MSADERDADQQSHADKSRMPGGRGHSVLKDIGKTVDLPRIQLHDTDVTLPERVEPLQNATALEIPTRDPDSRYQLQGEIVRSGMGVIIKGRVVDLG